MPYVPLNKVLTDLYTTGEEFIFENTGQSYTGPYHEYYNGEYFTNPTPDYPNPQKIVRRNDRFFETQSPEPGGDITLNISFEPIIPDINLPESEQQEVLAEIPRIQATYQQYLNAQGTSIQEFVPKKAVSIYYPQPTSQDYQLGEIQRYFVKQVNGLKYTEINKNTFTALANQSSEYFWQLYIPISLPWLISGEESEVIRVNSNMVKLAEKNNKIQGLGDFLQHNYLKFYKK